MNDKTKISPSINIASKASKIHDRRRRRRSMAKVHLSASEYADYRRSESWKRLRDEVWRRKDGPLCPFCQKRPATQVHHLAYRSIDDVHLSDLKPVCDLCHGRIHDLVKRQLLRLDSSEDGVVLFERTLQALRDKSLRRKTPVDANLARRILRSYTRLVIAGLLKRTIDDERDVLGMLITPAQRRHLMDMLRAPSRYRPPEWKRCTPSAYRYCARY